jgi:hypothetical protein
MDEESSVTKLSKSRFSFRLLESLGTDTKVYYYSEREWVRELGRNPGFAGKGSPKEKERHHG